MHAPPLLPWRRLPTSKLPRSTRAHSPSLHFAPPLGPSHAITAHAARSHDVTANTRTPPLHNRFNCVSGRSSILFSSPLLSPLLLSRPKKASSLRRAPAATPPAALAPVKPAEGDSEATTKPARDAAYSWKTCDWAKCGPNAESVFHCECSTKDKDGYVIVSEGARVRGGIE